MAMETSFDRAVSLAWWAIVAGLAVAIAVAFWR